MLSCSAFVLFFSCLLSRDIQEDLTGKQARKKRDGVIPVILVGNKADLRANAAIACVPEGSILPLMEAFPEIEMYVESSAKSLLHISEVSCLYNTYS